jgi:DNA topoisomerase-2
MEEGRRRKELGLPEVYLYEKDTRAVHYTDFVNKELVLFSNMDNERSIPRYGSFRIDCKISTVRY